MNALELRPLVFAELKKIAPELEEGDVAPGRLLRDQVDLDSMDWLNFLIAVHQRFGVEIAEADYATLDTLDRICEFVAARNPQAS
ncbi:MAG: acyl carrier protein [Betaproteobacteria bacterium]|nr:acyl carrier protein [Betaproteobacteria bacterium]